MRSSRVQRALCTFFFLLALTGQAAAIVARPNPPGDPYADPAHDPYNPLRYITSNALTGIAFALVLLVAISQTFCLYRWGARWMLSIVIGAYLFAFGISTRFGLHLHPQSRGLYIVEYLFVVLAPCAFIAADYVLLGQLARHLGASEYLAIPAHRITRVFVASDITTFLIQAAGGALSASANNTHSNLIGSRVRVLTGITSVSRNSDPTSQIFLAGLAIQLVSFATFTSIYLVFLYRVRKHKKDTWYQDSSKAWYNDWRALGFVLFLSCIGILIRSLYRVIELSQGYAGHLATTEAFFYGLDTLPLFIAVALYTPFWPGRFIDNSKFEKSEETI
ncbi:hypothetical protein H0H87_009671 [Tephrocybe sp. NHM501043]|nr:hypothetical protein H0H87_009671 [Tephrocybe sp. NHM501043]